jgi:hypothetical protein
MPSKRAGSTHIGRSDFLRLTAIARNPDQLGTEAWLAVRIYRFDELQI